MSQFSVFRIFGLWIFSIQLLSCAITAHMPLARLESPENAGENRKGFLSAAAGREHEIVVVPDVTVVPLAQDQQRLERSAGFIFGGGFALSQSAELKIKVHLPGPPAAQLKIQFLGLPESAATPGNFSGSWTGLLGLSSSSSTDKNAFTLVQSKHEDFITLVDTGLILGYRVSENFLGYGGPFVSATFVQSEVKQAVGDPSHAPSTFVNGRASQVGGHLGVQWDDGSTRIPFEVVYARASSKGLELKSLVYSLGIEFGID